MELSLTKKYENVVKLSIERRGEIIDRFTYLEMIMDCIISRYFCKTIKKVDEFTAVVLSTIDFSKKRDVVFYIIDCNKDFLTKHKTIKSDIDVLGKVRNIFAHRYLIITDKNIKAEKICLLKFEKGNPTEIEITQEYFNNQLALLDKSANSLKELNAIVKRKTPKKNNSTRLLN